MFLLRSAFWLIVAYAAIAPHAPLPDVGGLKDRTVAAGQQFVAGQVRATPCDSLQCEAGKAVLSVVFTSNPSSDSTMQDSNSTVPIPRPRPHWMG